MLLRALTAIAAVVACSAGVAAWADGPPDLDPAAQQLPDLYQETPWDIQVTRTPTGVYRLGFGSAVRNVGDGPLIIAASRPRTSVPTMTADQQIEQRDAPMAVVANVGRLRYVRSPDHEHWHLLRFDRYELRRAGRRKALVRDRKTGFCLGDRYRVRGLRLPARPSDPVYTSRCGLGRTERLAITEGISVGYGDVYEANLEGQSLKLTGLAAGRYRLVHRVNVGRRLLESNYANNAASLLLRLRWREGRPLVRIAG